MALPPTPRRVPAGCPPPVTHSREARSQRGGRRAKGRGRGAGLRAARLCAAGDGLLSAAGGGTGPPRDRCCPGVPWDHDEERRHAVISPYPHLNKPFWRASGSCGAGGEVGAPTGLRRSAVGDRARGAAGRTWGRCGEGGGAIGEGGGAYRERGGMPVVGGAYRGGRGQRWAGFAVKGRGPAVGGAYSEGAGPAVGGAVTRRAVPAMAPRPTELYRAPFPLYTVRLHPRRGLAITAGGGGAAKTGIGNGVVRRGSAPLLGEGGGGAPGGAGLSGGVPAALPAAGADRGAAERVAAALPRHRDPRHHEHGAERGLHRGGAGPQLPHPAAQRAGGRRGRRRR